MAVLGSIPAGASRYDKEQVREIAGKICESYLYKIEFMITSGDPRAAVLIGELGKLPEASAECLLKRNQMQQLLNQMSLDE